jgi:hypothetical protein
VNVVLNPEPWTLNQSLDYFRGVAVQVDQPARHADRAGLQAQPLRHAHGAFSFGYFTITFVANTTVVVWLRRWTNLHVM